MARTFLSSRIALAVALSSGLALCVATPALAAKKEAKPSAQSFSDGFRKAAGPIEKAMSDATSKLPPKAGPSDFATAKASIDAALGGNAAAAFQAAIPAATTPDDKNALGSMLRNYGIIAQDLKLRQQGLALQLGSGKVAPEALGMTNYDAGITAYQLNDYAASATYLKAAKDAGFVDSSGQLDAVLADAYKRGNNPAAALQISKDEIAAAKARGVAPSETALRAVLQAAYDAKQLAPSTEYAGLLARYYPGTWNTSISVVRQLASLPRDQNIDLMRLMFETGSLKDKGDYFEYLDNLDPRAYPGEAVKIIDDGVSKGKLTAAEVNADKTTAMSRIPGDKASLPATERDASKPGATAASVVVAGDVFLSYDQPAKAEGFYTKALGLPGVDANKAALRLGIAQVRQGKYAEAKANFAKVSGTRTPIAQLWSVYADSKASPAPAPAG